MLTIENDAIFLSCEKKSFKKDEEVISYGEIKFLDSNNEVVRATMSVDFYDRMLDEGMPSRLESVKIQMEVTEEEGRKGSYLKKKLVAIS